MMIEKTRANTAIYRAQNRIPLKNPPNAVTPFIQSPLEMEIYLNIRCPEQVSGKHYMLR